MKYSYCLLAVLCLGVTHAPAQKVRPLSVGDSVPDILFSHVTNAPFSKSRLSDWKTKLVILDFFATWCGPCVSALPHLDSLQNRLGNELQIFVVDSYDDPQATMVFLEKEKRILKGGLPFITGDTLLKQMFPHTLIPHEVWIKNGIVKSISLPGYVTAENIKKINRESDAAIPLKKDRLDFDRRQILSEIAGNINLRVSSVITGYLPGIASMAGYTISKDSQMIRTYYLNSPVLSLYQDAFGHKLPDNRVILEVADSSLFFQPGPEQQEWLSQAGYCYENVFPLHTAPELINSKMVADLNSYFHLQVRVEKRKLQCWALTMPNRHDTTFLTRGGKPGMATSKKTDNKFIRNLPLASLVKAMNYQPLGKAFSAVVVDETGFTGKVDMVLSVKDIQDIGAMQTALAPYGLQLAPAERVLPVLVISDPLLPILQNL